MRVVFMGTPEFAVPTLIKIAGDGHTIAAAYTRAPKPGGRRGLETRKTPIHQAAEALGVPVFTPPTLELRRRKRSFKVTGRTSALLSHMACCYQSRFSKVPDSGA